jgi:hypothetical protein
VAGFPRLAEGMPAPLVRWHVTVETAFFLPSQSLFCGHVSLGNRAG